MQELSPRRLGAVDEADTIAAKSQWPARGDARIQQPQTAGGGITRIGENLAAGFFLTLIERPESGKLHIYLAPDLDAIGHSIAQQAQRDGRDGARIGGYIFAITPIAPGGRSFQFAGLVQQTDCKPVELRLGAIGQRRFMLQFFA